MKYDTPSYTLRPLYALKVKNKDLFVSNYILGFDKDLKLDKREFSLLQFERKKVMVQLAKALSITFGINIIPYRIGVYRHYKTFLEV